MDKKVEDFIQLFWEFFRPQRVNREYVADTNIATYTIINDDKEFMTVKHNIKTNNVKIFKDEIYEEVNVKEDFDKFKKLFFDIYKR